MSKKCRILSISVVVGLVIAIAVALIIVLNKNKNKETNTIVYAESISFNTTAGKLELFMDNELIISKDMIKVTPNDCTFTPVFTMKKRGVLEEESITSNKYSFTSTGEYILYCRVKSSEKYSAEANLNITVVETPTSTTGMYITKLKSTILYVDEMVDLSSLVEMEYPAGATVDAQCGEHAIYENGKITAIKEGLATIDIYLTYDNITICETDSYIVKPPIIESDISVTLTINGNVIENNIVEITYSPFNFAVNYKIENAKEDQEIQCWTDSNILEVVRYSVPIIELKCLGIGEATLYISPTTYPNIIFEVSIIII